MMRKEYFFLICAFLKNMPKTFSVYESVLEEMTEFCNFININCSCYCYDITVNFKMYHTQN